MPREVDIEIDRTAAGAGGNQGDPEYIRESFVDEPDGFDPLPQKPVRQPRKEKASASEEEYDEGGEVDTRDDELDDAREAYTEEGYEAERPSRRQRRNRAKKERAQQSNAQIAALTAELTRVKGDLAKMSQGQLSLAVGDIDARIETERGYLRQIDSALATAATSGEPDARAQYLKATQLKDEAGQRLAQLYEQRRRIDYAATQAAQPVTAQPVTAPNAQVVPPPDPAAERYADIFMERHEWFDPDSSDEDSLMVLALDRALVAEGYTPNKADYWRTLERRVKARGLGGDENVERSRDQGGMPPRPHRGGGGDPDRPSGPNLKDLPKLARDTLDEIGLLDTNGLTKEQLAHRARLMKKWHTDLKAAGALR